MGADYSKAQWLPCKNFWPTGNGMERVVIHGTASGGPQTGYQLATGSEFNDGQSASVQYINDVDGTVYQVVSESDSAWGNCCVYGSECPAGYYPIPGTGNCYLNGLVSTDAGGPNQNHHAIEIENVKHSSDNSEPLTSAQYNSLVALVADICKRRNILPVKGSVIGHFDLDPRDKAHCPGTFDWPRFYTDLQIALGYGPMLPEEVHGYALSAGFTETQADIAVAVCHAESSLMRYRQGIVSDGSLDRGIAQINSHWHGEVADGVAYDPVQAMKEMYRISKNGTDFSSWTTYKNGSYLQYMTVLTPSGEVAVYPQSNQFENGESQSECGFFSNALAKAMAQPPSTPPHLDSEGVDQLTDQYYVQYDGANTSSNENGMSIQAQEGMLNALGIPFTHMAVDANSAHSHDVALITAWVRLGYPVIVTIPETSVYDMEVGGGPYDWVNSNPAAWQGVTHIVTVTGVDTRPGFAGHLMYRDTANWRDSPRTYSNDHIIFNRAIAINPSWLPRRADGFDPLVSTGGGSVPLPTGWTEEKDASGQPILKNPRNSFVVNGLFAKTILSAPSWDAADVPLENAKQLGIIEESNPKLGGGWRQTFNMHSMEWSFALNRFLYGWMGQELMFVRADRDVKAKALSDAQAALAAETSKEQGEAAQIVSLDQQIADLQAQLAAAGGSISPDEQAAINNAIAALQVLAQYKK